MEQLILALPLIFCVLTGVLIAWGLRVATHLTGFVRSVPSIKHVRSLEYLRLSIVATATLVLTLLLFFAPTFAAFHMVTIVVAELWYAAYLFWMVNEYVQAKRSHSKRSLRLALSDKNSP